MDLSLAELALVVGMATNFQADVDHGDLACLARSVYHEARGETLDGQLAVAYLTLNRVDDPRYPNAVCDVVTQDNIPDDGICQFAWYCDGLSDVPHELKAFKRAVLVSLAAMTGAADNPVPGATHYYAPSKVTPGWSYKLAEVAVIGHHRFMEE